MFGAGGGTSSYEEIENTDLIVLWGSNARETHPIFFHHVLKGIRKGARLIVVDPRRTTSAQWADLWLGIDVGSDIALSNAMAREIIVSDLVNETFVKRATMRFRAYRDSVMEWTLERGEQATGIPAEVIREFAHTYAKADRAEICWTLGITEHHNATDNVLALINLGLLCGHVGRYGSGLNPLRGQNNVQGGGDMGAIPNKLPGFQDIENDPEACARYEQVCGVPVIRKYGRNLTQMFDGMEHGVLTALYVIGENPASSEADVGRARKLMGNLDTLIVQDLFMTKTAKMADVVLPASNSAFESEGTVTNSERRVQRVRKVLEPPGDAKDDIWIIAQLAKRLGRDWGEVTPRSAWDELRARLADARRDDLRTPRGARGHPVAVLRRGARGDAVPARPAVGGGPGQARPQGAVQRDAVRAAGGRADRGVPAPPDDRPPARLVQHRCPDRRVHVAAPTRRDDRRVPRGRRSARRFGG